MWKQGCHVADIVEALKRPGIEVGFLIMDLAERCKLRPRKGGFALNASAQPAYTGECADRIVL